MRKTKFLLLGLACASMVGLTACGNKTSEKVLTIGLECNYTPFNWTETTSNNWTWEIKGQSGAYADGYDIQMARFLAADMGYKLEVVKLEWDALIPALQQGTINAVIAGMTDNEERRQSIDFTEEYYHSELVLVVQANGAYANASSLESFGNAKVVSQVSTVTDSIIDTWHDAYGTTHLTALKDFSTCAIAVQNGTADAMTAELPVANSIVNASNGTLSIVHFDQTILGDSTKELGVSIGIKKGDTTLETALNASLAKVDSATRSQWMIEATDRADGITSTSVSEIYTPSK